MKIKQSNLTEMMQILQRKILGKNVFVAIL